MSFSNKYEGENKKQPFSGAASRILTT